MTLKWDVLAAVWASKVPMAGKVIMARLVDKARAEDAVIPQQFTPSLNELAADCSASKSTVADQLDRLERGNWVKRERPTTADALARGEKTSYRLAIGDDELPPSKSKKGGGHARSKNEAGPGTGQGVVREPDPIEPCPGAGQVREPDRGEPGAGQPPVKEPDSPRPGAGHNNYPPTGGSSTHHSHQDPPPPPSSPSANDAATLPGFEHTEQAPPPPKKRKRASKPKPDKPPTEGQRADRLAKRYTDRVKLAPFHGVRNVVTAAIKTGEYTDEQIAAGIDQLVEQRKSVTANTLRFAIEGDRSRPRIDNRSVSTAEAIEAGWGQKGTHQ